MVKTILIDDALHSQVKQSAKNLGISINKFTVNSLLDGIELSKTDLKTEVDDETNV